ncbi:unnamed protein product [Parajaminaea phylloscopi]
MIYQIETSTAWLPPTCWARGDSFSLPICNSPSTSHHKLVHTHPSLEFTMENVNGDLVDLYVPRKCAATGRIIEAKDHASVQIAVADIDEQGRQIQGSSTLFPLSGYVRRAGESDDSLNRLATKEGLLRGVWSYQK